MVATGDESTDQRAVQQEVRQILKKKGTLKVVQDQKFQLGDVAVVDFDARRADTGQPFPGANRVRTQLDSDSSDMQFLPGQLSGCCCAALCFAVLCCAMLCCAVPCCTVPCCALLCPAVPCCALLCPAALCCALCSLLSALGSQLSALCQHLTLL